MPCYLLRKRYAFFFLLYSSCLVRGRQGILKTILVEVFFFHILQKGLKDKDISQQTFPRSLTATITTTKNREEVHMVPGR